MQTTGQAADIESAAATDAFHGAAGEIKGLLQAVAERIADAERRQALALNQMQERLAHLGHEARGMRPRIPSEFSLAFDRIEEGMSLLASRIAASAEASSYAPASFVPVSSPGNAAPMALRSAVTSSPGAPHSHGHKPSADTFDVVDTMPADEPHGWDAASADALARVYESSDAGLSRPDYGDAEARPAGMPHHGPAAVERDWLDQRLADIAKRIEGSLAQQRPDVSFAAISARFDQLESRFTSALENVATRSDVNGLRLVEAHISELAHQFEQAQGHFFRLDGIERQLAAVMDRLSDDRLAAIVHSSAHWPDLQQMITDATERVASLAGRFDPQSPPVPQPDFDRLARAAADEAVQRFAGHSPAATGGHEDAHQLADLRHMMETLVTERRQGDETTASMLDTMQQALIRLLDRMDAIEMGNFRAPHATALPPADPFTADHQHAGARHEPVSHFVAEPDFGGLTQAIPASARLESLAEPQLDVRAQQRPEPFAEAAFAQQAAADSRHGHFEPVADSSHQQRIEPTLGPVSEQMKQDYVAAARRARRGAVGQPALKTAAPPVASAMNSSARKEQDVARPAAREPEAVREAMPNAAAEAAGALSFLSVPRKLFLGGTTAVLAIIIAALLMPHSHQIANVLLQKSGPITTVGEAAAPREDRIIASVPEPAVRGADTVAAETSLDQLGPADIAEPGSSLDQIHAGGSVPLGITLQHTGDQLSPEELARVSRQQQMANISTELGAAAAAQPAALPADQSVVGRAAGPAGGDGKTRGALDLPPATVGPLSLRLAAAKGDPSAEFEVGARLAEGKGTNQNFVEAAKWYGRAAQQGFAQAQYRLGTLLERGLGQKADVQRARIWYKRAAEQGNVKAMHNLAVLSAGRQSTAPDYATAAQWFTEAARRGLADSQFNLAVLYESGLGVPKDLKQAYKFFALSARSGDKDSLKRRDQVAAQLTPEDRDAAEASIREWVGLPQDQMANDPRAAGEAWKARANGVDNG